MSDEPSAAAPAAGVDPAAYGFLLRVASLLHAYGTPAYRLERVLQKVAGSLGVEGSFLSTPTSVLVSLGAGTAKEVHLLRAESGEVNLGKLVEFDEVMEEVEHARLGPEEGTRRLEAVAAASSRYPAPVSALGFAAASAGAACIFGGGWPEIALAFLLGAVTFLLGRALPRRPDTIGLYEPLAAFLVAFGALAVARRLTPLDDRIVTLASLIVLLPGLTLTTGFTELASRHLVSGVARIAGAGAVFLTLFLGVALAWRLGEVLFGGAGAPPSEPAAAGGHPLGPWASWVAAAATPFAFGVLLEARPREMGVVFAVSFLGYAAGRLGASVLGGDLGPFLGALTVGLASNLYARASNRPALVPLTPGILLLVPGSLGFRSLTSFLDRQELAGMGWAFQTGVVAAALVGGLLAANVLLPPRRVL